ncbi:MAG: SLBB domain-containing protein [Candidatus Izemoplasmatales bacterium]|nr:SLBB domain-containing protein [Candidatus Izemoplasmatales bacterium]
MNTFIQKYGGFFLLFIGIVGIFLLNLQTTSSDAVVITTNASNYEQTLLTTEVEIYYVDIKGEIQYPGVYAVGKLMRISDVVQMAGGFLNDADTSTINLSKSVYDQMVIFIPKLNEEETFISNNDDYFVDVKGAVLYPGVYSVAEGTRVYEVIALAGGFSDEADSSGLNLSQEVVDEMVIYVNTIASESDSTSDLFKVFIGGEVLNPGEYYVSQKNTLQDLITMSGGLLNSANTINLAYLLNLYEGFTITIPKNSDSGMITTPSESNKINLNTANLEQLMTLKGIGIILGQRIIDYRAEFGFFDCIEDVVNVSGIKDNVYEQIKDYITV